MLNNANPGQAVYNPFLGSGTTLIAAQTANRVCFAIELDPLYVDVAVRRWQPFTGEKATLLADGRSFDEIASERLGSPYQITSTAATTAGAASYLGTPSPGTTEAAEAGTGATANRTDKPLRGRVRGKRGV